LLEWGKERMLFFLGGLAQHIQCIC
jgi:hypothetical protein